MERGATFGKNRELFVIVIFVRRWDCAKDVIQWQNRKIIELLSAFGNWVEDLRCVYILVLRCVSSRAHF